MGLVNVQFAIKDMTIYVIEVNPRASRTVPFGSKATGVPLAKCAARIMAGEKIADLHLPPEDRTLDHYSVKEAVMPFGRFPGADVILGPEMKSTGEVMGIANDFPAAYAKAELAIDYSLPTGGTAFISVNDDDKREVLHVARDLKNLGFSLIATEGTARALKAAGIPVEAVNKASEARPNILDRVANGEVDLIVNTPYGQETRSDGYQLRSAAVRYGICYVTTMSAANAMVLAITAAQDGRLEPYALQDLDQWEPAKPTPEEMVRK